MTELTERYLRNYLVKKSLVIAADAERSQAFAFLRSPLFKLIAAEDQEIERKRYSLAITILDQLRAEEAAALTAFLDHLRSEP